MNRWRKITGGGLIFLGVVALASEPSSLTYPVCAIAIGIVLLLRETKLVPKWESETERDEPVVEPRQRPPKPIAAKRSSPPRVSEVSETSVSETSVSETSAVSEVSEPVVPLTTRSWKRLLAVAALGSLVGLCAWGGHWFLTRGDVAIPPAPEGTWRWVPFVWKIEGEKPSYLVGTIHLPDDTLSKLHPAIVRAIEQSDAVYTEIPTDRATLDHVESAMHRGDGRRLADVVSPETHGRVRDVARKLGASPDFFDEFETWAISMQIPYLPTMPNRTGRLVLDAEIAARAESLNKRLDSLETVSEQLALFRSLSNIEQERMLNGSMDVFEAYRDKDRHLGVEMVRVYRTGNEDSIFSYALAFFDPNDDQDKHLLRRFLFDRNATMATRIKGILSSHPGSSALFAVGVGHLVGPESVVTHLRAYGFRVERVDVEPMDVGRIAYE